MGDYKNMNNKAKFILIGREMHGKYLTAVYLFNRQTHSRERVTKSRFMSMAEHNSIANCKASGGVLFGLQCNLRDIPVYDKKTGMIRSGAYTEEQIISLVESTLNTHKIVVVAKFRYQTKVVGYLVRDLTTGIESKYSKEAMYKAYSKGYLQNCKVYMSNGEIKVFDGDIERLPMIDVDSKGNVIDKQEETNKELQKEIEKEQKREEQYIKKIEKEQERVEKNLEERLAKAVDKQNTFKYVISQVTISCITKFPVSYKLSEIDTGDTYDIQVDEFEKWKEQVNPDMSHAKKVYRNSEVDIERALNNYYSSCGVDDTYKQRMCKLVEFDKLYIMSLSELNSYMDKINKKVELNLDFKINSITYYTERHTFRIREISVTKNNQSVKISAEEYNYMWMNQIVFGPSIEELMNNPLQLTDKYKIFLYNNEEIGFAIRELVKTKGFGENSLKRIVSNIKSMIKDRKSVGLDTLIKMIELEVFKLQQKNLEFLKKKYGHCISEIDMKNVRNQLMSSIQSSEGGLFCDINTDLEVDIVPFSCRKITRESMKYCIANDVMCIGTKENYSFILPDNTWVDLLSYVIINLSLVYGSSMDVRVLHKKIVILDTNININNSHTLKMREALENKESSLHEVENMLYNHIDPELLTRLGNGDDFVASNGDVTDRVMRPIYK